ncbi:type IX secretion system membrane protein, PorP/SprF family [Pustulibacterium marinum]|uniref:Type IX secretion system membrane protein, PorP/SprF family n=2 Tax=Pustulibacterium marinum TaxID=1224947 RepID=A0A1I7G262_9FLAO|nr:type IX secretion system membrane protein, PorP/SprF family [Pustulibacterium marinum]
MCLLFGFTVKAQQDPQYTQYMYNMSVVNPAYATDDPDVIKLGGLYRAQWVGFEGAPTTQSFFIHNTFPNNVEMGLSIVNDDIGNVVSETNVYADFAYVLRFSEKLKLSLGLKAGATFYDANFTGFQFSDDAPDNAFAENISRTMPNVGTGFFLFGENFYFGLSAPNLLKSHHIENQDGIAYQAVEDIHYFATGGYVFQLNEDVKLKPAFMLKAAYDAPVSLDITSNVLFHDVFEVGVGYRWDDAVSGLFNFRISPTVRVGYAYDYTLTNLSKYASGSHEVMVLFDISKIGKPKGYDVSPRFF